MKSVTAKAKSWKKTKGDEHHASVVGFVLSPIQEILPFAVQGVFSAPLYAAD
jgi:hypothetical protein